MTKIQMNLEIMNALTFFGIDHSAYRKLVVIYGSATELHKMLELGFENGVSELEVMIEAYDELASMRYSLRNVEGVIYADKYGVTVTGTDPLEILNKIKG